MNKTVRCEADIWIEKTDSVMVRPNENDGVDIVRLGESTLFFYEGQLEAFYKIIGEHLGTVKARRAVSSIQSKDDWEAEKVDAEAK